MNNFWIELSEESKEELIEKYRSLKVMSDINSLNKVLLLEELFGINNLNPKQPIKIWEDIEDLYPEYKVWINGFIAFSIDNKYIGNNKISNGIIAMLKIAKLIELGYGGMITDEEWKCVTMPKYIIELRSNGDLVCEVSYCFKRFVAFRTQQQREEFLKFNKNLLKDYYMMP